MEVITDCQKILALNIERILRMKKIKQQDLATNAGISVSFISEITNSKANPSINNIQKIADALGVPFPLLFVPLGQNWFETPSVSNPNHVYVFARVTKQESFYIKKIVETP